MVHDGKAVVRPVTTGIIEGEADVLPFVANRLPADLLARVRSVALLGLSETADFEFHVSEWIRRPRASQYRTVPETDRLTVPVLCVRGADEDDSACGNLKGPRVRSVEVGQNHHFSGNYAQLVDMILRTN